jgi:AcrR family transcriptional regulator
MDIDFQLINAEHKQLERQIKREALMQAAVKMFNQKGFHATSLDEVAQALKISKPTIYHYLGNKEQILMTCLEAGVAHLLQAAQQVQQYHDDGATRVRQFLSLYGLRILDDFGRCVILTSDDVLSLAAQQHLQQQKRQVHQAFVNLLEYAMLDGTIVSSHHAKLLAVTLMGAMNSAATWYRRDGELSAEHVVEQMVNILMQGLLPQHPLRQSQS